MSVVEEMRASLRQAMKSRDKVAVSALRTAVAAVENAEAPPIDTAALEERGVLTQHERIELSTADVDAILRAQIEERAQAIDTLADRGQDDTIERLHREITILQPFLR